MRARDFVHGPWRAVPVLGVTQIISWGSIFYTPVLIVPLIAAERGWSIAFAMGGFSVGLLTAGLVSPLVGRSIDRFGGHVVMTVGSLIGALGLLLIVHAAHPLAYHRGLDGARRRHGGEPLRFRLRHARPHFRRRRAAADHRADARRRLCLDRELAGDAFSASSASAGSGTYLIYAALLAWSSAPLHAFALPRHRARSRRAGGADDADAGEGAAARTGSPFVLVASAFAAYAFVPSGLSAHLLGDLRAAPASTPARWCGSARCSGRRKSARG